MKGKVQLVADYAEKFGVSKKEAETAIDRTVEVIKDSLLNDGGVKFVGLFTIDTATRSARDYKNPATGETVHKDSCKTLKIKVGSNLSKELNG